MPQLSVIIVTYNTRAMTLDCLRTLYAGLQGIDAEVFVVDNASSDGTAQAIRAQFPAVQLIENSDNRGFGAANNQAMRLARGNYFLLLNSDAFPEPGAIQSLLQELEPQEKVGALGPRLLNADRSLQLSCFRFPSPGRAWAENLWLAKLFSGTRFGDYTRWPHDAPRIVDWVIGACLLLRREVYEQVGGFDERFFMYAEESDWQRRMRLAGWQVAFTPRAEVVHLAGASAADGKPAPAARINPVFFESLDYYQRKHHGLAGLLLLRLAMILGCSLRLALWMAAWLLPSRRPAARQKIRLHAWLIRRQLFTRPPALVAPPSAPHSPAPAAAHSS